VKPVKPVKLVPLVTGGDTDALIKIQVLYSVKNDLTAKPPSRADSVQGCLPGDVRVVTDHHLMSSIERLVRDARTLAASMTDIPVLE
jgi:hypothetical protein